MRSRKREGEEKREENGRKREEARSAKKRTSDGELTTFSSLIYLDW